jgi:hypothetical protein
MIRADDQWVGESYRVAAPMPDRRIWRAMAHSSGAADVPAFGLVEIYTYDYINKAFLVRRPLTDSCMCIAAAVAPIPLGHYGGITFDAGPDGFQVLYATGTAPAMGQRLGSKSGSFEAQLDYCGLIALWTEDETNRICRVRLLG